MRNTFSKIFWLIYGFYYLQSLLGLTQIKSTFIILAWAAGICSSRNECPQLADKEPPYFCLLWARDGKYGYCSNQSDY